MLYVCRLRKPPDHETCHDLTERRCVIFGFGIVFDMLDAERGHIPSQARQWPLVKKAGQIERGIGHQLAASDADEEIDIFALDIGKNCIRCRISEMGMSQSERACIAAP